MIRRIQPLLILLFLIVVFPIEHAMAQTEADIELVTKTLGRAQTKASTLSYMAGIEQRSGNWTKALAEYEQMLAIYEGDPGLGKDSAKYAWALARIATCQQALGQTKEAEQTCHDALFIAGKSIHAPSEANYVRDVISDCLKIVSQPVVIALLKVADNQKPVPRLHPIAASEIPDIDLRVKETEAKLAASQDTSSQNYFIDLLDLANFYTLQRKYDLAAPLFKQVITYAETKFGTDSKMLITPLSNYGYMLLQQGKKQEAQQIEQRLETIY